MALDGAELNIPLMIREQQALFHDITESAMH